jgi:protein-S-isoprenylcysteine O-methyltransferase Ste14
VWLLVAATLYFWWLDGHLQKPEDTYWEVGMLVAGRRPPSWRDIRQHFAGWTVKAFFVPLMIGYLSEEVNVAHVFLHQPFTGAALFDVGYHLSYLMDLLFGVVGYCCTFRVIDTHIRSTEPTLLGWLAALLCYQPFFVVIEAQFLRYEDGLRWSEWLADSPHLRFAWGSAIVALLFVYAASSMAFGLRFSNLTHRGVITSGPYRFTKHPAYLAKNLSWWLISVPFVSQSSFGDGLRNCLALAALNLLYLLRARTEERHLRCDPTYVAYAQWIEEHGLFRKLRYARRLPSFISIFPRGTT